MDSIKELFHFLTDVEGMIRTGGLVALAIIVFVETGLMIGFFLPGDSLLVTAGLFAARGTFDIVALNLLLITMAILGDATGYYIGRRMGPALFRREDSKLFRKAHLVRTQLFYEKHGGKTIIIARFVPIVRTFAPVVAGIAGMNYRRFAAFNIFGGIGWVVSMTMTGYILGRVIPNIDKYIEIVILAVIFLSILPGIIETWRARSATKKAEAAYRAVIDRLMKHFVREGGFADDDIEAALKRLDAKKLDSEAGVEEYVTTDAVRVRAHRKDGRIEFLEVRTHVTPDTHLLSDAGYQDAIWQNEARFRNASETSKLYLGDPDRPAAALPAREVAVWKVGTGELRIEHRHEKRELPFEIVMIIKP